MPPPRTCFQALLLPLPTPTILSCHPNAYSTPPFPNPASGALHGSPVQAPHSRVPRAPFPLPLLPCPLSPICRFSAVIYLSLSGGAYFFLAAVTLNCTHQATHQHGPVRNSPTLQCSELKINQGLCSKCLLIRSRQTYLEVDDVAVVHHVRLALLHTPRGPTHTH